MGYARKDVEKTMKFVRYQEGAELYSIGLTEAKAVQKIDKVALVNCEIFEKYLETFFKKNTTKPIDILGIQGYNTKHEMKGDMTK